MSISGGYSKPQYEDDITFAEIRYVNTVVSTYLERRSEFVIRTDGNTMVWEYFAPLAHQVATAVEIASICYRTPRVID